MRTTLVAIVLLLGLLAALASAVGPRDSSGATANVNDPQCATSRAGDTGHCSVTWECDGERYNVDCSWNGAVYDCDCYLNSVVQQNFQSSDFCQSAGDSTQKPAADTGCNWSVP